MNALSQPQLAKMSASLSQNVRFKASVRVSPVGLVAIAVLVSAILLSTSVLVGTAMRK